MSVGWRNGCRGKKNGWVQEGKKKKGEERKERREVHCHWLTDLEGFAYKRRTADGKSAVSGLMLQTQKMFC